MALTLHELKKTGSMTLSVPDTTKFINKIDKLAFIHEKSTGVGDGYKEIWTRYDFGTIEIVYHKTPGREKNYYTVTVI